MVFALNALVTFTFDLLTSKCIGAIYWPWTDGRHTIIRPKFHFGPIKMKRKLLLHAISDVSMLIYL